MSKNIDFSKPLSEDDQEYAASRPWLRREAELTGIDLSEETDFSLEEEDDEDETPEGFEEGNGDGDSSDDESEDEGDGDGDEEEEEVLPYSEWDYADLKTEAGERDLPKTGSKEQLIERLEANDRENAE